MKKLIHLKHNDSNYYILLQDLLDDVGDVGNNYIWSILEFEAIGYLSNGLSHDEFDTLIAKEPSGYCLSWDELKDLASRLDQVINVTIVASENKAYIAPYKRNWNNVFKNFPLVLTILDGSYWEVSTSDEKIIDRLKSKYKILKICDV